VTAPLIALSNTRDARGDYARRFISQAMLPASNALPTHFYHFRLCIGAHPLPLGWTLSVQSMCEMRHQLLNQQTQTRNSPFNKKQLEEIANHGSSAASADACAEQK